MISLEQHQLRRIKVSRDSLTMPHQKDQQTSKYRYGSSVQCLGLLEIIQGNLQSLCITGESMCPATSMSLLKSL